LGIEVRRFEGDFTDVAPWRSAPFGAAERLVGWTARRATMKDRQAHLLRRAFLIGAITDGLALVPMLIPPVARRVWGFTNPSAPYQFAMGYGASLMLGWTVLLLWAYQRPIERRFVAALTVLVIYGLVATEIAVVWSGHLEAWRMIPTWCLQTVLLSLFSSAYHYPTLKRWVAA
jgi:hypothetical protein